jgi:low affinity Fe/Cu permease
MYSVEEAFRKTAAKIAKASGSVWAFVIALLAIIIWIVTGPIFDYSDTWQLAINTTTTIITFLMVFLIQNTQNRDSKAVHLKLDELVRSVKGARMKLMEIEELPNEELEGLSEEFRAMNTRYNDELARRRRRRAKEAREERVRLAAKKH